MNYLSTLLFILMNTLSNCLISQIDKIEFPIIIRQGEILPDEKIESYKLDSIKIESNFFYFLLNSEKPHLSKYEIGDSIHISCDFEGLKWIIFENKKILVFNPFYGLQEHSHISDSEDGVIDGVLSNSAIIVVTQQGRVLRSRLMSDRSYFNDIQPFLEYLSFMRKNGLNGRVIN